MITRKVTSGNRKCRLERCGQLKYNVPADNCIPNDVFEMGHEQYGTFLEKRRFLMAKKIRKYYESL